VLILVVGGGGGGGDGGEDCDFVVVVVGGGITVDNEHEGPINRGGDTEDAIHKFPLVHKLVVPNCIRYSYTPHGTCTPSICS